MHLSLICQTPFRLVLAHLWLKLQIYFYQREPYCADTRCALQYEKRLESDADLKRQTNRVIVGDKVNKVVAMGKNLFMMKNSTLY